MNNRLFRVFTRNEESQYSTVWTVSWVISTTTFSELTARVGDGLLGRMEMNPGTA